MSDDSLRLTILTMAFEGKVKIDLPRFFSFCPVIYPGWDSKIGDIETIKYENSFRGLDDGKNTKTFPHTCDMRIRFSESQNPAHFSFHISSSKEYQSAKICAAKNYSNSQRIVEAFFEKIRYLQKILNEIHQYPEEFQNLLKILKKNLILRKKFSFRKPNLTPKRYEKSNYPVFMNILKEFLDRSFKKESEIYDFLLSKTEPFFQHPEWFLQHIEVRNIFEIDESETLTQNRFLPFVKNYLEDSFENSSQLIENLKWFSEAEFIYQEKLRIRKLYPTMIKSSYHLPFLLDLDKFRDYLNDLFERKIQQNFYVIYIHGIPCMIQVKIPKEKEKIISIMIGLDLEKSQTNFSFSSPGYPVLERLKELLLLIQENIDEISQPDTSF